MFHRMGVTVTQKRVITSTQAMKANMNLEEEKKTEGSRIKHASFCIQEQEEEKQTS